MLRPGNAAEVTALPTLLTGVPLHQTAELLGDKAYDRAAVRRGLAARGISATIPGKANRRAPIWFDAWSYQGRHLVENAFADLKQFRGVACRYAKLAENYAGFVNLASWFIGTKQGQRPEPVYQRAETIRKV